jgi:hypothetical protein
LGAQADSQTHTAATATTQVLPVTHTPF